MPNPSIAGAWSGEYFYAPGTRLLDGRTAVPVPFTLEVRELNSGEFSGRILDDPVLGIPVKALVSGVVDGLRLSFVKSYREIYLSSPEGRLSLRDHIWQKYRGVLIGPEPEQNIIYRGVLSEDGAEVTGSWRIDPWQTAFRSGWKTLTLKAPGGAGTWRARRNSAITGILSS